jgi:transposase
LGVERTVVEGVAFDEDEGLLVAYVRPRKGSRQRCGRCGRRGVWYDRGECRRRWRSLDAGPVRVVLEADAARVNCPEHGPTVTQMPWARHDAGHTYAFDDQVAWLAVHTSKTMSTGRADIGHGPATRDEVRARYAAAATTVLAVKGFSWRFVSARRGWAPV